MGWCSSTSWSSSSSSSCSRCSSRRSCGGCNRGMWLCSRSSRCVPRFRLWWFPWCSMDHPTMSSRWCLWCHTTTTPTMIRCCSKTRCVYSSFTCFSTSPCIIFFSVDFSCMSTIKFGSLWCYLASVILYSRHLFSNALHRIQLTIRSWCVISV